MATKIQLRRDTAADWTSTNPTLAAGEIGFESDTNKFKIGDGATAWTSLNYAPEGYITATSTDTLQNKTIDTANNTITISEADISDLGSYITASSSDTLTNKTFDANGTGNSISNIETADIAAATLVTAAEGIGSNNNDTTLPTSAAVKAYADSVPGTITALNNQAENRLTTIGATTTELDGEANLTFDGSTLAITGGLTTTTSLGNDAITLDDNVIKSSRSNDNLILQTNSGTAIELNPDGDSFYDATMFGDFFGATSNARGLTFNRLRSIDGGDTVRHYEVIFNMENTLTGSGTASNFRPRLMTCASTTDLAGFSYTRDSFSRGPTALTFNTTVLNSSATASTINNVRGFDAQVGAYASTSGNSQGNITVDRATAANATIIVGDDGGGGGGVFTITNGYSYRAAHYFVSGDVLSNYYAFYYSGADNDALSGTNEYAFYDNANALSRFGAVILANQASDPSTVTDSAHIYAKDDAASSEVYVRDEAGNVTKISPHNEAGEWEYYSVNKNTGKKVRVNMERMIRKLEEFTGETFIESE